MPTLADITVKKYDNTTDIVWKGINPNGGDGGRSLFRPDVAFASTPTGFRPVFMTSQRTSAQGRVSQIDAAYPHTYVETNTGLIRMIRGVTMKVILTVDPGVPFATQSEGAYQLLNLAASASIKDHLMSGIGFN